MRVPGLGADFTTALLDIDGTLLDSNDAHARAWVDALSDGGYAVPFERVRPLIGMGADHLLPALSLGLSTSTEPGRSIVKRRGEIFKQRYEAGLQPTRGARTLLLALRAGGAACVVATSAKAEETNALLARAQVADLVTAASTSDDADASKPAPDIVHAALQRAGATAAASFMLGDTKYDVAAALRAGVAVVAVRCGGSSDADLAGAAAIYDDPLSLVAAMRSS